MTGPAAASDLDLVRLAQDGDDDAFGVLVDRHRRAVYRAALAACGSPAEADDVAQDALVAAHRRLASFRGDAAFRTWLLTIAWRKALDRRRRLRRWFRPPAARDEEDWLERLPQPGGTHEADAAARELQRDVRRLIRSLPRPLRLALLLAGSGEYSYAEIAVMLDVPVGTVKWRVSEARRILKAKLIAAGHGVG